MNETTFIFGAGLAGGFAYWAVVATLPVDTGAYARLQRRAGYGASAARAC